ncbi:MAG: sigma-54 interaction domain-containing protein [Gemmatimonadales bacterium]
MSDRQALGIIQLTDSFSSLWGEFGEELELDCVYLETDDQPRQDSIAVLVAGGGEEDRAIDLLSGLKHDERVPVYVVGARASHRFGVEAVRRGATDYFALPDDIDLLRRTLTARADAGKSLHESRSEAATIFDTLLGESDALKKTLEQAVRVIRHGDVTVLIGGETGTGKELLARGLHDGGPRGDGPFVAVNCAAIPSELMESELFGHEKGAFTDASTAKPGLFEEAHTGTLFLDEVGHLPLPLQGKLLRALDDRRIRRVGATQSQEIDVRIIAATHVDLSDAVQRGEFREDLFYRLNVVSLTLPPLRDRGNDVIVLAESFASSLAERYGLPKPPISADTRDVLLSHPWKGNVRELRHAVERSLLLSEPGKLEAEHLVSTPAAAKDGALQGIPFPAPLQEILAAVAQMAIEHCSGNRSAAARQLGISRARLQRLLERGEETRA